MAARFAAPERRAENGVLTKQSDVYSWVRAEAPLHRMGYLCAHASTNFSGMLPLNVAEASHADIPELICVTDSTILHIRPNITCTCG
jgi:hypothetical protein